MVYQSRSNPMGKICLLVIFITGILSACNKSTSIDIKPIDVPVLNKTTLLDTIADDFKGKVQLNSPANHSPTKSQSEFTFSDKGGGVFYVVENKDGSYVVHNGAHGKPYKALGVVAMSPDGKRLAYGALKGDKWCMVIDGKESELYDSVQSPLFSDDGKHITYRVNKGERSHLVVDSSINAGTDTRYLASYFSNDSKNIVYIDNLDSQDRGRLVVSDLQFKNPIVLAQAGVTGLTSNGSKTRFAAIVSNGGMQVVWSFSAGNVQKIAKSSGYNAVSMVALSETDGAFAFYAERDGNRFIVCNNKEYAIPPGDNVSGQILINRDSRGFTALRLRDNKAFVWQASVNNESKSEEFDEVSYVSVAPDGKSYTFVARSGLADFVYYDGRRGQIFDKVVSPKFSPDGKFIVYRARKNGKRFVVVADNTAKTIKTYKNYEQVFDVKFTDDGRSIAYGVKDGNRLIWNVDKL